MKSDWWKFSICGAAAGIANGLFGAGGGMILVPLLIRLGGLEDKKAFASSICIILPMCLISLLIYAKQDVLAVADALPYLIGGTIGGVAAGLLFRRVSANFLHKAFGILILWGGIRLLR